MKTSINNLGAIALVSASLLNTNIARAGEPDFYFDHADIALVCKHGDKFVASVILEPYLVNGQQIPEDRMINSDDLRVDIPLNLSGRVVQFNSSTAYGISDSYLNAMNLPCDEAVKPVVDIQDKDKHLTIRVDDDNTAVAGFFDLDAGVYTCGEYAPTARAKFEVLKPMMNISLDGNIKNVAQVRLNLGEDDIRIAMCDLKVKLGGE